jgi:hypothetical protein
VLGLSISHDGTVWVATTLPIAPSGAPVAAAGDVRVPCCRVVESEHASLPLEGWLLRVDPATDRVTAKIALSGSRPKAETGTTALRGQTSRASAGARS